MQIRFFLYVFFYICDCKPIDEKCNMAFDIQQWLKNSIKDEVLFLYDGEVTSSLIANSLDEIEENIEEASSKIKKKIYNVLVECLQNLFHHSSDISYIDEKIKGRFAVCVLSKNDNNYSIKAGNFITGSQKNFLAAHLEHINLLDKEALKNLYKEILNNQEFSEKGGGGLGMVDMARKSGSKLKFCFYKYNDELYFFDLVINILDN